MHCAFYLPSSRVKGQIRTVFLKMEWRDEGGWGVRSHLMIGQEEEKGRGEVVSVSTLLVLIGVLRKVFDK